MNIKWTHQRAELAILLSIMTVAIFLRIKGLTTQSYWVDELFSVHASRPSLTLTESITVTIGDEVHPPLYQILLWGWYKAWGYSEFSGRFFSSVTGVLSILAIHFLGKEIRNTRTGLYSAAIMATNVFLIYYSQEVRSYSLLVLFSILSFLYIIRFLKYRSKDAAFIYIIAATSLIYTHYYGMIVVAAQALCFMFYLLSTQNKLVFARIGTIIYIIIGIASLPLLKPIMIGVKKTSFWIPKPEPGYFVEYFQKYFGDSFLALIFVLLIILFFTRLLLERNKNEELISFFLVIWVGFCWYIPYLRSLMSTPMLWDRYTIVVVPAIIIMIAIGLDSINAKEIKNSLMLVIFVISISYLFVEKKFYSSVYKDQMREVSLFVAAEKHAYPIYSYSATDMRYNAYFELLGVGLNAKHIRILKKSLKTQREPKHFWLIDAHHGAHRINKTLQELSLKVIKKRKFYGAYATLIKMN